MAVTDVYNTGVYLARNPGWHIEDSAWKANKIAEILRANGVAPVSVAEIGCGAGMILQHLAQLLPGAALTGYDVSSDAAAMWRDLPPGVEYIHADASADGRQYDLLLLMDVLEHVPDYIGFLGSLRVKAPLHLLHVPLDMNVQQLLRDGQIGVRSDLGHLHYFSAATVRATLEDCGYHVVDWRWTCSQADLAHKSRSLKRKIARVPRIALYGLSPSVAAKLLGGVSALVLARAG